MVAVRCFYVCILYFIRFYCVKPPDMLRRPSPKWEDTCLLPSTAFCLSRNQPPPLNFFLRVACHLKSISFCARKSVSNLFRPLKVAIKALSAPPHNLRLFTTVCFVFCFFTTVRQKKRRRMATVL